MTTPKTPKTPTTTDGRPKRRGARRTATSQAGGLAAAMATHTTAEVEVIEGEIVEAGHPDLVDAIPAQAGPPADPNTAVALSFNPDAAPKERGARLRYFETVIRAANDRYAATMRQAQLQRILDAGMALEYINTEELYYDDEHPDRTFVQYVEETFGYKSSQAYTIMDTVPVRAALTAGGIEDVPSTEQVKVLAPVVRNHSPERAVEVWQLATSLRGKPTGAALRQARKDLNVAPAEAPKTEEPAAAQAAGTENAVTILGKAVNSARHARSLLSRTVIAAARQQDPETTDKYLADLAQAVKGLTGLLP